MKLLQTISHSRLTLLFNLELEIGPPWGPQTTRKNINIEQASLSNELT